MAAIAAADGEAKGAALLHAGGCAIQTDHPGRRQRILDSHQHGIVIRGAEGAVRFGQLACVLAAVLKEVALGGVDVPILYADHLGCKAGVGQGVIQIAKLTFIAVGVGVGAVEAGIEVHKTIPLAKGAAALLERLARQRGEGSTHDLARLRGRIIAGQHPDGVLHAIGVQVADEQQIPAQRLETLPQHLGGGDPQGVAVALTIQRIGAGVVGVILKAGGALGLEVVDHQRQGRIPLGRAELLQQGFAHALIDGNRLAAGVQGLGLLHRQHYEAGGTLWRHAGGPVDESHRNGIGTYGLAIGRGYPAVVIRFIRLSGVEGLDQIGDGGVVAVAVVLYLHQPHHIGIEAGDGADDLGTLLLELRHCQGATVAAGGVGIPAHHCGEEVEHVEAGDPQIPRLGELGGFYPVPAAVVYVTAVDAVARHQPEQVVGVTQRPLQPVEFVADAQVAIFGIEGGIPGQHPIRRLGVRLHHQLILLVAQGPLARLLAQGGKLLGRLDEGRAIREHQVVALAIVIEAEVAGHHQAGLGHQPHLHPLVALQQLVQGLARHRHQVHRREQGYHGLGHHQFIGIYLGLVEVLLHLARDAHLGPRHYGAVGLGAVDEETVRAGRIPVSLRILNEEALVETVYHLSDDATGGMGLLGFKLAGRHQRAAAAGALNGGHGYQLIDRADECRGQSAIAGTIATAAQAAGVILRGGHVFKRRIEGARRISPARGDSGLAAQGHVQGRDAAGHPGRARIHPHLPEAVHYLAAAIEHQSIVTVEHQVAAGLGRLGQDLGVGGRICQHQAGARG